jgi:hypothetical protein
MPEHYIFTSILSFLYIHVCNTHFASFSVALIQNTLVFDTFVPFKTLQKSVKSRLKTRLQFHLAHKLGDEKKLMEYHQELEDVIEDQLSLASIHYLRSHYQEAIDIYKRILLDNR